MLGFPGEQTTNRIYFVCATKMNVLWKRFSIELTAISKADLVDVPVNLTSKHVVSISLSKKKKNYLVEICESFLPEED